MSAPIISVEKLGKKYRLDHQVARQRYTTLREVVSRQAERLLHAPFSWRSGPTPPRTEEFWALDDVSFDVRQGEVVGIIGRNGAGKSTLLKLLSRITEPTRGRIHLRGRVASLLEVGTGFHPELTGRENIYLNGAILGMSRAEIRRKFDEIVAFAEVEKFLDTPVKRYSSGMYVRLAFAVAAHLESDILIVDEVLAVGDYEFQTKCLKRMGEVGQTGRTVFFVSHSMPAVQKLCSRVLTFSKGRISKDSDAASAISEYLRQDVGDFYTAEPSVEAPTITEASVAWGDGSILLAVEFQSPFPLVPPVLGFVFYDSSGAPLFGTNTRIDRPSCVPRSNRCGRFEVSIPSDNIRPGRYLVSLWLGDNNGDYCELEKVLRVSLRPGFESDAITGSFYVSVDWRYSAPHASRHDRPQETDLTKVG